MRRGSSSKLRARCGFWLMLCIASAGSAGMQLLALLAAGERDDAFMPALYRYEPDAMPSCEQLLGRQPLVLPPQAVDWARLGGLMPPAATDGKCRPGTRLAV